MKRSFIIVANRGIVNEFQYTDEKHLSGFLCAVMNGNALTFKQNSARVFEIVDETDANMKNLLKMLGIAKNKYITSNVFAVRSEVGKLWNDILQHSASISEIENINTLVDQYNKTCKPFVINVWQKDGEYFIVKSNKNTAQINSRYGLNGYTHCYTYQSDAAGHIEVTPAIYSAFYRDSAKFDEHIIYLIHQKHIKNLTTGLLEHGYITTEQAATIK